MPAKRRALRELQKPLNDLRASPVYPVFEDEQSKGRQKIGQAKNRSSHDKYNVRAIKQYKNQISIIHISKDWGPITKISNHLFLVDATTEQF